MIFDTCKNKLFYGQFSINFLSQYFSRPVAEWILILRASTYIIICHYRWYSNITILSVILNLKIVVIKNIWFIILTYFCLFRSFIIRLHISISAICSRFRINIFCNHWWFYDIDIIILEIAVKLLNLSLLHKPPYKLSLLSIFLTLFFAWLTFNAKLIFK